MKAVNCKVYPLAPNMQTQLDKFIQENLTTNSSLKVTHGVASLLYKEEGSVSPTGISAKPQQVYILVPTNR
jgi:hypothetical protein